MVQATLSIMGLYNYDSSVLDGLIQNLPTAAKIPVDDVHVVGQDLNADALLTELLAQSGELEFVCPNPDAAKKIITAWALINANRWQKLYNTMWFSYNPIWNKDGSVTRTETETRDLSSTDSGTTKNSGTGKETRNLSSTDSGNQTSSMTGKETRNITITDSPATTVTETKKVAGYNSNDFVNSEQNTTENSGTNTRNDTGTVDNTTNDTTTTENTRSDTGTVDNTVSTATENSNQKTDTGTITRSYTSRETGNIGVTETQTMIQDEREIVNFNMSQIIINDFISRFCILVY